MVRLMSFHVDFADAAISASIGLPEHRRTPHSFLGSAPVRYVIDRNH